MNCAALRGGRRRGAGLHGTAGRIVRVSTRGHRALPVEFIEGIAEIGMSTVTTTVHDGYFMFIKLNYKLPVSPTDRDAVAGAELELRRRQHRAIGLIRQHVPGCRKAFIARTSPSLCIRRGRCLACDYDLTNAEIRVGQISPFVRCLF